MFDRLKELFTERVQPFLNYELFKVGDTKITAGGILLGLFAMLAATWVAKFVDKGMEQTFLRAGIHGRGRANTARRLVRYLVLVVGFIIALGSMGINVNALFTAGAIFAVGIGFAMQNISQNFVSGVILLLERTITPGDILEVDGTVVRVEEMNIRSTVARNRDDEQLIIPNATLAQSTVKNLTLGDSRKRVRAEVGVAYGTDLQATLAVLSEAALKPSGRAEEITPVVVMKHLVIPQSCSKRACGPKIPGTLSTSKADCCSRWQRRFKRRTSPSRSPNSTSTSTRKSCKP